MIEDQWWGLLKSEHLYLNVFCFSSFMVFWTEDVGGCWLWLVGKRSTGGVLFPLGGRWWFSVLAGWTVAVGGDGWFSAFIQQDICVVFVP